ITGGGITGGASHWGGQVLFLNYLHLEFLHGTPPRIELPGASYRVTSHADRHNPISVVDVDRESL
ncbi:hypothetical protein, partial [Candidatus Accumulibacter contiguus]|uniref:hypothetical protein n=1 Tax=Candidatus Accumulibacter contiguus TaxID=2954381 RepID=UPI003567532A